MYSANGKTNLNDAPDNLGRYGSEEDSPSNVAELWTRSKVLLGGLTIGMNEVGIIQTYKIVC